MRRVYGMRNGSTILALHNYAAGLSKEGRAAEAEPLLREAVEAAPAVWDADSIETLQVRRTYAGALQDVGRTDEAETQMIEILAAFRRLLGADSGQTIIAANNLALLRTDVGRAAEGEPLFREALASAQRIGSGLHERFVRRNLGYCLMRQKRFDEAERELLKVYQQFKTDDPAPNANDRTAARLVELYTAWNKPAEAQRWRATTQPATRPSAGAS